MATSFSFGKMRPDRRVKPCLEPTSLSVYGEPSDAARAALDGFGAAYLGTFGGFTR